MGVVAFDDFTFGPIDVELRVEVFALAFVSDEPIEAGPRLVVFFTHVPLANVGSVIPTALQYHREALKIRRILGKIVHHSVTVSIESAQNAGATRRAQRRRAKCIFKIDTLLPESVDVGRLDVFASAESEGIPALIIREDEKNIGLFFCCIQRDNQQRSEVESTERKESYFNHG